MAATCDLSLGRFSLQRLTGKRERTNDISKDDGGAPKKYSLSQIRPPCYKACLLSFFKVIRVNTKQTRYIGTNHTEGILEDLNMIFKVGDKINTDVMANQVVDECNPLRNYERKLIT